MKSQVLFSSKDKEKNLKCRLLQFLFGALRVIFFYLMAHISNVYYFIYYSSGLFKKKKKTKTWLIFRPCFES